MIVSLNIFYNNNSKELTCKSACTVHSINSIETHSFNFSIDTDKLVVNKLTTEDFIDDIINAEGSEAEDQVYSRIDYGPTQTVQDSRERLNSFNLEFKTDFDCSLRIFLKSAASLLENIFE